jgi:hypothetical protein
VVLLYRPRIGSILNQILRPIQRFPQCLKRVRIVAFAFFLNGSVSKSADRRTQTFEGFVPNPEKARQSTFQGFALASKFFWAGGGITTFSVSERTKRILCKTFQVRNRLCFDASSSSSKSFIAFGVIDMPKSVRMNT